jgi:ribosomal protein L10
MMDDLIEQVEECDEEMKGMREEHREEMASVKCQVSRNTMIHDSVVMTLSSKLEHVT